MSYKNRSLDHYTAFHRRRWKISFVSNSLLIIGIFLFLNESFLFHGARFPCNFARHIWPTWGNRVAKHRKDNICLSALLLSCQWLVTLLLTVSWHNAVFISLSLISVFLSVSLEKMMTLLLSIGVPPGIPY